MAVEINITAPASAAPAAPAVGTMSDLLTQGFCRAPGYQPQVEVWLINGATNDKAHLPAVLAPTAAPGVYQWSATFLGLIGFNIAAPKYHCVQAILTTNAPPGSLDFLMRVVEVHFTANMFPPILPPQRRGGGKGGVEKGKRKTRRRA